MNERLMNDLQNLSHVHVIEISDDLSWVKVNDFVMPPGFNCDLCNVLIELPRDYPQSPPGCARHIYIPRDVRWQGRQLRDLHPNVMPRNGKGWAWLCFEWIKWNPMQDNLITTVELIRTTRRGRDSRTAKIINS